MSSRWGWRATTTVSLAFLSLGALILAAIGHDRAFWPMAAGFFVFGIGLGSGTVAPTQALVDALPPAKQGVASAVNDAARELGAALGIAITGSVFNAAYRHHVAHDVALRGLHGHAAVISSVRASPAIGLALADHLRGAGARIVTAAVTGATVSGWDAAFITIAVAFLVAAGVIWFGMRGRAESVTIAPPARTATPASS
jgi:MFS family permease